MANYLTAEQIAEKHNRRTKQSLQDIEAGVQSVTESPCHKAASRKDKMLRNLTAAVNNGKWAKGLMAVSTEEWKSKMIQKGIPRISEGLDAAKDKVVAFHQVRIPFQQKISDKLKTMPDTTLEDSIQRMNYQVREMSKFPGYK